MLSLPRPSVRTPVCPRSRKPSLPRAILRVILSVLLILWTLLDAIMQPLFGPLICKLSELRLLDWLAGCRRSRRFQPD